MPTRIFEIPALAAQAEIDPEKTTFSTNGHGTKGYEHSVSNGSDHQAGIFAALGLIALDLSKNGALVIPGTNGHDTSVDVKKRILSLRTILEQKLEVDLMSKLHHGAVIAIDGEPVVAGSWHPTEEYIASAAARFATRADVHGVVGTEDEIIKVLGELFPMSITLPNCMVPIEITGAQVRIIEQKKYETVAYEANVHPGSKRVQFVLEYSGEPVEDLVGYSHVGLKPHAVS